MSSFQLECSVLKKSWGNLLFGENEMTREKLEKYIQNNYSAEPDYPWVKYPDYEVFRHTSNKKWFALIMEIPKDKLGLQTKDILSVVNFKCDPIMIGSFLNKEGYFPAYHMNKTSWITVALDGSVPDDEIRMLLDMSFEATAPKIRKKNFDIFFSSLREEESFSQRAFSIYTDIRKLQDKAKTSYTLSTRRLRFGYE